MPKPDTSEWPEAKMERLRVRCEERNVHLWTLPDNPTLDAMSRHHTRCVACRRDQNDVTNRNMKPTYAHRCEYYQAKDGVIRCRCGNWKVRTWHSSPDDLPTEDEVFAAERREKMKVIQGSDVPF